MASSYAPRENARIGALIALLFCSLSSAETINLGQGGCIVLKNCYAVPNDTDVDILTNAKAEWQSTEFALYIDGVRYSSPSGNELSISNLQLTAPDGAEILFTGSWSMKTVRVNSGRAHYTKHVYTFLGGTVER